MRCPTKYDKPIQIRQLSGTADAHGHIDETDPANWIEYTTGFADCVSKGGREFWRIQQVNADVSHVWYTQWTPTMVKATPEMRLVHEGLVYEMISVIDIDNDHQEIELQTKRAV